jgi:hypothetical protein
MACRTYVIKTTGPEEKVTYELKCYGTCTDGKECEPEYFNPDMSKERVYRTCYCKEEVDCGAPACNPSFSSAGKKNLKGCRIALIHKFKSDGTIEENATGVECLGVCADDKKKCQLIEQGLTQFDEIKIEVLRCSCK